MMEGSGARPEIHDQQCPDARGQGATGLHAWGQRALDGDKPRAEEAVEGEWCQLEEAAGTAHAAQEGNSVSGHVEQRMRSEEEEQSEPEHQFQPGRRRFVGAPAVAKA
jgi:hypothetical protein